MKALLLKLGFVMSALTFASGLWENYNYNLLILKPIAVFFIWIVVTFSLRHVFSMIFKPDEPEEETGEDAENSQDNPEAAETAATEVVEAN